MQIHGKKKPNNDSDHVISDDTESNAEEFETYDGFAGTNIETQVRGVTPKPRGTDTFGLRIGYNKCYAKFHFNLYLYAQIK